MNDTSNTSGPVDPVDSVDPTDVDINPGIYLGADGGYHDDTPENRERFPAPDTTSELAQDALPDGEPVPFTDDGHLDGEALARDTMASPERSAETSPEAGTVSPAGDAAGSVDTDSTALGGGQTAVETEPAGANTDTAPAAPAPKPRKQ